MKARVDRRLLKLGTVLGGRRRGGRPAGSGRDDFTGSQRATFYSGGTSQNVSADGAGAYAQAVAGVSARTVRNITLYLEGDANFGGDHSGAGARFGARF